MSMFPGAGAEVYYNEVYYNEAGEPLGWDYPSTDPADYYCGECGASHAGVCPIDDFGDDDFGDDFGDDGDEDGDDEAIRADEFRQR